VVFYPKYCNRSTYDRLVRMTIHQTMPVLALQIRMNTKTTILKRPCLSTRMYEGVPFRSKSSKVSAWYVNDCKYAVLLADFLLISLRLLPKIGYAG